MGRESRWISFMPKSSHRADRHCLAGDFVHLVARLGFTRCSLSQPQLPRQESGIERESENGCVTRANVAREKQCISREQRVLPPCVCVEGDRLDSQDSIANQSTSSNLLPLPSLSLSLSLFLALTHSLPCTLPGCATLFPSFLPDW